MSGNQRIIAQVKVITRSGDTADTDAEFIINYLCTGAVSGEIMGEIVVQTDVTVSEGALTNALKALVADALNSRVPGQAYVANDVRGCSL